MTFLNHPKAKIHSGSRKYFLNTDDQAVDQTLRRLRGVFLAAVGARGNL